MSRGRKGRLVLIVEPDLDFADDTRSLLDGDRVITARSMEEAVEIAEGGRVDAVVLGPSFGSEAGALSAAKLLAVDPGLAVVMVANVLTNRVLRAALRVGMVDAVDTPLTLRKLTEALGRAPEPIPEPAVEIVVETEQQPISAAEQQPPSAAVPVRYPEPAVAVPGPVPAASAIATEEVSTSSVASAAGFAFGQVIGDAAIEPTHVGASPHAAFPAVETDMTEATVPDPVPSPAEPAFEPAAAAPEPTPLVSEPVPTQDVPIPAEPTTQPVPEPLPRVDPAPAALEPLPPVDPAPTASVPVVDAPFGPPGGRSADLLPPKDGPVPSVAAQPSAPPMPGAPPPLPAGLEPLPDKEPMPIRKPGGGKVITVMAGKGGSGKTVAATNLATALTGELGEDQVAIVDADLQFGDVSLLLQLDPTRTIVDAAKSIDDLSEPRLDALLLRHDSGLRVLPAPLVPISGDEVTPKTVVRLIEMLRGMYRYVVVDTAPIFDDGLITILEHSDEVILVVDMDLPSVKNAKIALDTLRASDYDLDRVHMLVNRVNSKARLDLGELERSLGKEVAAAVPSDRLVPQSVNEGVPAVALSPRSKVAKAFGALARLFLPED